MTGVLTDDLRVANAVQMTIPPRRSAQQPSQHGTGTQLPTTIDPMNPVFLQKLRKALLRWFDHHQRNLPWRRDRHPYRVWVSEVMLQQTRVAAVLDHYGKFMERFPDVRSLARARPATVLASWSGLGYYRRARLLHAAARKIVRERQGRFPRGSADWLELPGIGRYTAAAIASICYDEACAVVDGNVERLLRRLLGTAVGEIWATANRILSSRRPGVFNQGMMELGALVCTPRAPRCDECPLVQWCATAKPTAQPSLSAEASGFVALASRPAVPSVHSGQAVRASTPSPVGASSPGSARRGRGDRQLAPKRRERAELTYALVIQGNRVLLTRRPDGQSVMPGMWELPAFDSASMLPMSSLAAAEAAPDANNADHGRSLTVRHAIMNTDYVVSVVRPTAQTGVIAVSGARWFAVKRAAALPLTGLARKILKLAGII
jgi:A/G-specific adenine glycosylase